MASRVRWFGLGATVGTVVVLRVARAFRSRVEQASPSSLIRRASSSARDLSEDLRSAIEGGLDTMRREANSGVTITDVPSHEVPPGREELPRGEVRSHRPFQRPFVSRNRSRG